MKPWLEGKTDSPSRALLKTSCSLMGIQEIRLIVATKIDTWALNTKVQTAFRTFWIVKLAELMSKYSVFDDPFYLCTLSISSSFCNRATSISNEKLKVFRPKDLWASCFCSLAVTWEMQRLRMQTKRHWDGCSEWGMSRENRSVCFELNQRLETLPSFEESPILRRKRTFQEEMKQFGNNYFSDAICSRSDNSWSGSQIRGQHSHYRQTHSQQWIWIACQ